MSSIFSFYTYCKGISTGKNLVSATAGSASSIRSIRASSSPAQSQAAHRAGRTTPKLSASVSIRPSTATASIKRFISAHGDCSKASISETLGQRPPQRI